MCPSYALICLALALVGSSVGFGRQLWLVWHSARRGPWRFDQPWSRLRRVIVDGIGQRGLRSDRWPGLAHLMIFWGFMLLLPRSLVLFGRGFDAEFGSGLARSSGFGAAVAGAYQWLRASVTIGVLAGVLVFVALRLGRRSRFRPTPIALGILATIGALMLTDLVYEAAGRVLALEALATRTAHAQPDNCLLRTRLIAPFVVDLQGRVGSLWFPDPGTERVAWLLSKLSRGSLVRLGVACYALHLLLIAGFMAVLPYTKHLHLVSVWPNLFFDEIGPTGRLSAVAQDPEALLALVEAAIDVPAEHVPSIRRSPIGHDVGGAWVRAGAEHVPSIRRSPIGVDSLFDVGPKQRLDWFACTACGRCTEHCPATATGKVLDPRALIRDLRAHLQATPFSPARAAEHLGIPLVPAVISAQAVWACTNCAACEEQCPTAVRTISPIVQWRRHLLLMRAQAPIELQRVFDGIERQSNPWGLALAARTKWADGLGVPLIGDHRHVEYLYWVGCAASYDARAQSVARALVRLMRRAGVSFAILGPEERCTGDIARRAGNELLYLQLAQRNIELLNRYQAEGRFERIITACPHCLTTIGHAYPDLGGKYTVVSHVEALEQWVAAGRLHLQPSEEEQVATYHDPCNLARYARVTQAPVQLMALVPGLKNVPPTHHGRHTLCCGAGGAQMWLKEEGSSRMNTHRGHELGLTGANYVVTACPFCRLTLDDALRTLPSGRSMNVLDLAEIIEQRCTDDRADQAYTTKPSTLPSVRLQRCTDDRADQA